MNIPVVLIVALAFCLVVWYLLSGEGKRYTPQLQELVTKVRWIEHEYGVAPTAEIFILALLTTNREELDVRADFQLSGRVHKLVDEFVNAALRSEMGRPARKRADQLLESAWKISREAGIDTSKLGIGDVVAAATQLDGDSKDILGAITRDMKLGYVANLINGPLLRILSTAQVTGGVDLSEAIARGYVDNLSAEVIQNGLRGLLDRSVYTKQLVEAVTGRFSVALLGHEGVGKTTLVRILASMLPDRTVYAFNSLPPVEDLIQIGRQQRVILFVDEGHRLSKSYMDMLKPAIAAGEIVLVLATTSKEFELLAVGDPAFVDRFKQIVVLPPTKGEMLILMGPQLEEHGVNPDGKAAREALELLYNWTAARVPRTRSDPRRCCMVLEWALQHTPYGEIPSADTVAEAVAAFGNSSFVTAGVVRGNVGPQMDKLSTHMRDHVLGQNHAVLPLLDIVGAKLSGFLPSKPATIIIFGPTGVGKTATVKELVAGLSADTSGGFPFLYLDMATMARPHDAARFLGAPPGYVGHRDTTPFVEFGRHGIGIVLMDELEKASLEEIQKALMQPLEEGLATSGQGQLVDYKGHIIIATSNLPVMDHIPPNDLAQIYNWEARKIDGYLRKILKAHFPGVFRPEFLNRIDLLCLYRELTPEVMKEIVVQILKNEVGGPLANWGTTLQITDDAISYLLKVWDPTDGARPIRRVAHAEILPTIARYQPLREGQSAVIKVESGQLKVIVR